MFRTISAVVLSLVVGSTALAYDEAYFTIKNVKVTDVTKKYAPFLDLYAETGTSDRCVDKLAPDSFKLDDSVSDEMNPISKGSVIVDQIINMGKKIWAIIEAGKPTANLKMDSASALPRGAKCWTDLAGWAVPNTTVYQIDYENFYGAKVVSFTYRLSFTAKGNMNGVGQYITNAHFMPANLDVSWGYTFDATADIPSVINHGTKEAPMAGMQMNMNWKVSTVVKTTQMSESFFATGDNKLIRLK